MNSSDRHTEWFILFYRWSAASGMFTQKLVVYLVQKLSRKHYAYWIHCPHLIYHFIELYMAIHCNCRNHHSKNQTSVFKCCKEIHVSLKTLIYTCWLQESSYKKSDLYLKYKQINSCFLRNVFDWQKTRRYICELDTNWTERERERKGKIGGLLHYSPQSFIITISYSLA